MIGYNQRAGQKQRLTINSDATRGAVAQAAGWVCWGTLRANRPARRVDLQPPLLACLVEENKRVSSVCLSNKWAAKDAELKRSGYACPLGSAPLTPIR